MNKLVFYLGALKGSRSNKVTFNFKQSPHDTKKKKKKSDNNKTTTTSTTTATTSTTTTTTTTTTTASAAAATTTTISNKKNKLLTKTITRFVKMRLAFFSLLLFSLKIKQTKKL